MPKTCQTKWQENSQLSAALKLMDSSLSLRWFTDGTLSAIRRFCRTRLWPGGCQTLRRNTARLRHAQASAAGAAACIRFAGCREFFVHESAIIDEGATIERGQRSAFAHACSGCDGENVSLGRTFVGNRASSEMAARFRTMSAFMTTLPLSKMFSAVPVWCSLTS